MIRKIVATLLMVALPSMTALAGKPDHAGGSKGKGNGNSQGQGNANKGKSKQGGGSGGGGESWGNEHYDRDHSPRFTSTDRDDWRDYWNDQYQHGNCPPGLAKKNNGCMPPGLAKKRYQVGHPLPPDIVILPVPAILLPRLSPCPPGYRYGMIDGDLVKLAVGSLLVVDAIEGLTSR
jgi:hypothetical protein